MQPVKDGLTGQCRVEKRGDGVGFEEQLGEQKHKIVRDSSLKQTWERCKKNKKGAKNDHTQTWKQSWVMLYLTAH